MRNLFHAFVIPLLSILLGGCSAGDGGASSTVNAQPEKAVAVTIVRAEERVIDRRVEIVGSLMPEDEVIVSSEVKGILSRINVDLGSTVHRGDLIAQLDQRTFQLQLEQAEAALAQGRAKLGLRSSDTDEIDPEDTSVVRQARAALFEAKSKYESAKQLLSSGDIAEITYIEAEKAFKVGEAAYRAALDEVRDQLAGIRRLRAQVALAKKNLSDTSILAPLTGSVTVKHVSEGEYIKEGAPIVTLVQVNPLRLRADVPEPYAASVEAGRELSFTVDALGKERFRGHITRLSPSVNAETRSLTIEAEIDNRNNRLKPGYFARAEVVVQPGAKAVMVPRSAVVRYVGLTKVFIVEAGHASERSVKLGARTDGWVEVVEGLQPDDMVITTDVSRLRDGQPVAVVEEEAPPTK